MHVTDQVVDLRERDREVRSSVQQALEDLDFAATSHPLRTTPVVPSAERAGEPTAAPERPRTAHPAPAFKSLSVALMDAGVAAVMVVTVLLTLVVQGTVPALGLLATPFLGAFWVLCLVVARAYEERILWSGNEEVQRVGTGSALAGLVVLGSGWVFAPDYLASAAVIALGGSLVGTLAARAVLRSFAQAANKRGAVRLRVLAVGPRADVEAVTDRIHRNSYHGWHVVDQVVLDPADGTPRGLHHDGGRTDVVVRAREAAADVVMFCQGTSITDLQDLRHTQRELEADGRELAIAPPLVEAIGPRVTVPTVCGLPIIRIGHPELSGSRRLVKAIADRTVSGVAVLLLLPFFAVVAAAVRLTSRGPAFFTQQRVGLDGELFTMIKFRTMKVDAEQTKQALLDTNEGAGPLFKLKVDPRVTRVGSLLRRTSLDELPQLINILRGDMSFVGPRPALPTEVDQYDDVERRRLLVKPGLTGLWQIHGRSDLPWAETRRLDVRYVENWSLGFDLSILTRTVGAVLRARGAY
ncbi:sugar transferase [Aquipuribacter sp. MA13-6]|uniref:sugar transferase n=1 Tax=unclassified Aquipuribacter TaxID=2635084 RepID=UPI003EE9CF88